MKLLKLSLLLLICTFSLCGASANPNIPEGWRLPTTEELEHKSYKWRHESLEKYQVVRADFDGDGLADEATLLVSVNGRQYGLFVLLGSGGVRQLDVGEIAVLQFMGITAKEKGTHKTACGKGYWDCKKGEPQFITLTNTGVTYFKDESAASVFYWVPSTKKFNRVWVSD